MAGIIFLIMVTVLTAALTASMDVFVSKRKGVDQRNCGCHLYPPCKSLEYAFRNKASASKIVIKIDGGDNMLKPYVYIVKSLQLLYADITIRKTGNARPSIVTSKYIPSTLFQTFGGGKTLEVNGIQFYNVSLVAIGSSTTVRITNCRINNGIPFIHVFTKLAYGPSNIDIFNSELNNSYLLLKHKDHLKINIFNTSVSKGENGYGFLVKEGHGTLDLKMLNCIVRDEISINYSFKQSRKSSILRKVNISNTQFIGNNTNKFAIKVFHSTLVTIRHCIFEGYTDTAIKLIGINSFRIIHSKFTKNSGILGGALYAKESAGIITKSIFLSNTAQNGGAIYWEHGSKLFAIMNSRFISNQARLSGGGIYTGMEQQGGGAEVLLRNVTLRGSKPPELSGILIHSMAPIILRNVTMIVVITLPGWSETGFYCTRGCNIGTFNKSYEFTYTCPQNHDVEPVFTEYQGRSVISKIQCIRCKKTTYTERKVNMKIMHKENNSAVVGFDLKCRKCPLGGKCDGRITSRGNFWGYQSMTNHGILFIPCPFLYCCSAHGTKCISYNTCGKNRKGVLCGSCMPGYRVNIFEGECTAKARCWKYLFWLLYILYTIVYTVLLLYYKDVFMFVLKQFKNLNEKRNKRDLTEPIIDNLSDNISQYEEVCENFHATNEASEDINQCSTTSYDLDSSGESKEGIDVINTSRKSHTSTVTHFLNASISRNIAGIKTILFFFYQIAALSQIKQHGQEAQAFLDDSRKVISSALNLKFISAKLSKLCPSENLTIIGKEIVQNGTIPSAMALLFLVLFSRALQKKWRKRNKANVLPTKYSKRFQTKVKLCIIQLTLLAYTGVSAFCLKMVNCVNINNTGHLYIQGDVVCYSWWQYLIMVFLCIWIVPFPFTTYMSVKMLEKGKISVTQFYICFSFPSYAIHQYVGRRIVNFDFDVVQRSDDKKEKDGIVELFTNPYRIKSSTESTMNWEVVVLIRRLILSALCTCITNPVFKTLATFPVLLVIQLHHWYKYPFYNNMLNRMETASLSVLILLNNLNLIWALDYLYDLSNLPGFQLINTVFIWVRDIILLLPPLFILVVLMITAVKKLVVVTRKCIEKEITDDIIHLEY